MTFNVELLAGTLKVSVQQAIPFCAFFQGTQYCGKAIYTSSPSPSGTNIAAKEENTL